MTLSHWCIAILTTGLLISKTVGKFHELSILNFTLPETVHDGSMFGYSISYEIPSKTLLVSAPTADKTGQVFRCSLNHYNCTQINIKVDATRETRDGQKYDHNLLLGTFIVSGSTFSVTCAPRFTKYFISKRFNDFGVFGQCYYIPENAMSNVTIMLPARVEYVEKKLKDKFELLTDGYGWSAFVTIKDEVLIGSPLMDAGRMLIYHRPSEVPYLIDSKVIINEFSFNFGYSIVGGNFLTKNKNETLFSSSTPYGNDGLGKVIVFLTKDKVYVKRVLQDDMVGSLFGAVLCAADVDGDGIDDLLVGAPTYVPEDSRDFDIGAVHVYQNLYDQNKMRKRTVLGHKRGSYFGNAVINIGDLDGDGYEDICIGAPYEDDGRGAVYLYSGATLTRDDIITWMQKIQVEGIKGLGLSLAPLRDYDENGCNELAIGAPDSNMVFLLHSMATITLILNPEFPNIQLLPTNITNFKFKSCFNVIYPPKLKKVTANINITVDIRHRDAKIVQPNIGKPFEYEIIINVTQSIYCRDIEVHMPKDGDYSEALKYKIKAELQENPINRKKFDPSRVLLSPGSKLTAQDSIPAARGCRDKEKCVPILEMELSWTIPKTYIIGSTKTESVEVTLRSLGETAYAACVRVSTEGVRVLKPPQSCVLDEPDVYTCAPRGPLINGAIWEMGKMFLEMKYLTSSSKSIKVVAKLYDYCKNDNVTEIQIKEVYLRTDAKRVIVKSTSDYQNIIKFTQLDLKDETNVNYLEHKFTITNDGSTIWTGLAGVLELEQQPYLTISNIKINTDSCELPPSSVSGQFKKTCNLPELGRNNVIAILIRMKIHPKALDGVLNKRNVTITTALTLQLGNYVNRRNFSNLLVFQENAEVPMSIILIASIIGFVILLLIGLILYEVGFFGRKNKCKLENLKRDIKRQSKRQARVDPASDSPEIEETTEVVE